MRPSRSAASPSRNGSPIRAIRCPVLMIAPGAEPVGHASTYEDMKVRIPDNELVYYDGARHNICDYLPDRCAADTLAWLQRRLFVAVGERRPDRVLLDVFAL
jgi:alpha-beta hydrolase superfamily lysophospholipase